MENLEIRSLENVSIKDVYDAFMESFSDYEIPISLSISQFQEMMITRDIDLSHSVGCFNRNQLVGFIICGYREINGKKYCYDGGTGIIPNFRRRGIADRLFSYLVELLKEKEIEIFLLEVLENNLPAIELYRKKGFVTHRVLKCFQIKKKELPDDITHNYAIKSDKEEYWRIADSSFQAYMPSWQNDRISVQNNLSNYNYCSLSSDQQIIAFGFINKKGGDIPQLRVRKGWEGKQLELFVINELKSKTDSEVVKLVTLDEDNSLVTILPKLGFANIVNLYEMTLNLD